MICSRSGSGTCCSCRIQKAPVDPRGSVDLQMRQGGRRESSVRWSGYAATAGPRARVERCCAGGLPRTPRRTSHGDRPCERCRPGLPGRRTSYGVRLPHHRHWAVNGRSASRIAIVVLASRACRHHGCGRPGRAHRRSRSSRPARSRWRRPCLPLSRPFLVPPPAAQSGQWGAFGLAAGVVRSPTGAACVTICGRDGCSLSVTRRSRGQPPIEDIPHRSTRCPDIASRETFFRARST
jgi:hypothetical protein